MAVYMVLLIFVLALAFVSWRALTMLRLLNRGKRRRHGAGGYVYAFSDRPRWFWLPSTTVKIGRATDPKERMRPHRTAAPFGLRIWWVMQVSNDRAAEAALHDYYLDIRVRSDGEWFHMTPMLLIDTLVMRWVLGGRSNIAS